MPSIVALDIETTGLDPYTDSIIEIGAVRFNERRIEDEFSTLINPKRPIPAMITQLTNITNEMVRNAPVIHDVLQELADFIGDAPVLGHNVQFDASFLKNLGILELNELIDTFELASVLLPTANRYNLGSLCQNLGIILTDAHRAMHDAKATQALYIYLCEEAMKLPMELVAEFVRLSEPFDWGASYAFHQVLKAKSRQPVAARQVGKSISGPLFNLNDDALAPPLVKNEQPTPLDPDEIASLLEYGGPFSHYFQAYEHRPQQVEMLRLVTRALSEGQHLMVEAGTGTGKSFAYLVPAALWAIKNNHRVVISTNTINLQEQLISKDIPDLRAALNIDLRATVLKGRSNYICPLRLQIMRERSPSNSDEMRVLAKLLVWLLHNGSGDRSEITLTGPVDQDIWMRLSAENEGCKGETCLTHMGGVCPFYHARQASQSAHLIIINHALLLADVATGNRVLPDYEYLIIDEAHHLEDATTNSLSYRVTQNDLNRLLRELGGMSTGILGHMLTLLKDGLRPSDLAGFSQSIQRATDLAFRINHDFSVFFQSIEKFLSERREDRPIGPYSQQERIIPATRTLPSWADVEISWEQADETLKLLFNLLTQVHKSVSNLGGNLPEELEDSLGNLGNVLRRMGEAEVNLTSLVNNPNNNTIYWAEIQPDGSRIALQIAPLHIGPLMEKFLWHEKSSVILTSATLTANGAFDYIRSRLFADEADEMALDSPFDYENSTLLYLANDIPEPQNSTEYTRAVEHVLINLSKATGGRLLALFTSYAQLKHASKAITPALLEDDILVYEQGEGASASTLLDSFRNANKAVLLGTRAFWEGVDIPGEALSVLVICKLPFAVPSDPIVAARSETFEDAFNEYSLPEAILQFRQGFGRLIRTQTDRGVVAILDRRVLSKRYGKAFIESLPACKLQIGSMKDLPKAAARWLNI